MSEELLVDVPTERGMDPEEAALAQRLYSAIQRHATRTDRGQQAAEFRVGVSDLGYCSERTRRMLDRQVPDDADMMLAWIGTALGDHFEQAVLADTALFPDALRQMTVTVPLAGDQRTYEVEGHPDLVLPVEGYLLDGKTSYGLAMARRLGADRQKRFQRHCYAKGAWLAGLFGDRPLAEVKVGNVWIDRSGISREVHVELEPYSEEVLFEAAQWLDEVVYAFINKTEAAKEPPREVCEATCGFFTDCRAFDTDVQGLLTGPEALMAVEMYLEGKDLEKEGKRLKNEAKAALRDTSGSTGTYTVRWVHVNESQVPSFTRSGYSRLDIRRIR